MRVPSPILSVLKHHAGEPAPGDENIQVPAVALPVLEIPVGLTESLPGGGSEAPRSESFLVSQNITRNDIGSAFFPLNGLRPGLWHLYLCLAVAWDFAPAAAYMSTGTIIGIRMPAAIGAFCPLLVINGSTGGANANARTEIMELTISLERESVLELSTGPTAVGQTLQIQATVYGARLL